MFLMKHIRCLKSKWIAFVFTCGCPINVLYVCSVCLLHSGASRLLISQMMVPAVLLLSH